MDYSSYQAEQLGAKAGMVIGTIYRIAREITLVIIVLHFVIKFW
jgi:hypothetical protein